MKLPFDKKEIRGLFPLQIYFQNYYEIMWPAPDKEMEGPKQR